MGQAGPRCDKEKGPELERILDRQRERGRGRGRKEWEWRKIEKDKGSNRLNERKGKKRGRRRGAKRGWGGECGSKGEGGR